MSGGQAQSTAPTDSVTSSAIAAVTNPSSESVKIHPLVILNISDHFTRTRAQVWMGCPDITPKDITIM